MESGKEVGREYQNRTGIESYSGKYKNFFTSSKIEYSLKIPTLVSLSLTTVCKITWPLLFDHVEVKLFSLWLILVISVIVSFVSMRREVSLHL